MRLIKGRVVQLAFYEPRSSIVKYAGNIYKGGISHAGLITGLWDWYQIQGKKDLYLHRSLILDTDGAEVNQLIQKEEESFYHYNFLTWRRHEKSIRDGQRLNLKACPVCASKAYRTSNAPRS